MVGGVGRWRVMLSTFDRRPLAKARTFLMWSVVGFGVMFMMLVFSPSILEIGGNSGNDAN